MNNDILILREVVVKITQLLAGMGLEVTQRGNRAFVGTCKRTHKPQVVNIPYLPDNASKELILAIQGFIDHEVAHILETKFEVHAKIDKQAKKRPLLRSLWNSFEDTFIERRMAKRFSGSGYNLERLHEFFLAEVTTPPLEAAIAAQDWQRAFSVLFVPLVRAYSGQRAFQAFIKAGDYENHPVLGALIARVAPFAAEVPRLSSTWECLALAERVDDALKPPPAPPAPPPPPAPAPPPPPSDDEQEKDEEPENEPQGANGGEGETPEDEGKGPADEPQDNDAGDDEQTGSAGAGEEDSSEDDGEDDADTQGDAADGDPASDDDEAGEGATGDADDDEQGGEGDDAEDQGSGSGDGVEDDPGEPGDGAADAGDEDPAGEDAEDQSDGAGAEPADEPEEGDDRGEDAEAGGAGDGGSDEAPGDEDASGAGDDEGEDGKPGAAGDEGDEGDEGEDLSDDGGGAGPAGDEAGDDEDPADLNDPAADASGSEDPNRAGAFIPISAIEEFEEGMVKAIAEEARAMNGAAPYRIYTRDFDVIEPFPVDKAAYQDAWMTALDERTRSSVGVMQKDIQRMMAARSQVQNVPGFRSGRLHTAGLHRLAAGDDRVFRRRHENVSKDIAVELLIDNSGSMDGIKMHTAMEAGYALSLTLERVGIQHEVLGFTTKWAPWGQEMQEAERAARENGMPYSRYEPIYMPIYKSFDERLTSEVKQRFAAAPHADEFMGQNIDGESLEMASWRLLKRKETRKVMLVLSDGNPMCHGDIPAARAHLKKTVGDIEKRGVETIGIGIMTDAPRHFYPKFVLLPNAADLPKAVMGELKKILLS